MFQSIQRIIFLRYAREINVVVLWVVLGDRTLICSLRCILINDIRGTVLGENQQVKVGGDNIEYKDSNQAASMVCTAKLDPSHERQM